MHPANLVTSENRQHLHDILDEAFELPGENIVPAHAKDVGHNNTFQPAGAGFLNFDYYLHHREQATVEVLLFIHGLSEEQVDAAVRFLHERLQTGR